MISNFPPRPTGNDRAAQFMQWVWDTMHSMRAVQNPTSMTSRTTRGVRHQPRPQVGGGIEIEVTLCDPSTGEEKTYYLVGREKPPDPPT